MPLIRYSAALAATSGYTALVLFGLRSFYRDQFGSTALGYWIAANRISDLSNQLLGLFMIQFYVSHVTGLDDPVERRRFILRCWAAATALMGLGLLVFSLAGRALVSLFLSDAFLPAVPIIQTYLFGDVLTVWASLAMYTAFARGKPGRYAAIEMGTVSLMAMIAVALDGIGQPARAAARLCRGLCGDRAPRHDRLPLVVRPSRPARRPRARRPRPRDARRIAGRGSAARISRTSERGRAACAAARPPRGTPAASPHSTFSLTP